MNLSDRIRGVLRRRPSRIGMRLLAFNLLVLFVPIAGTFYLDVYEDRLLETQERGMVQQARVLAAALSAGGPLDEARATAVLGAVGEHGEARIKIYGRDGQLLADSARLLAPSSLRPSASYPEAASIRTKVL